MQAAQASSIINKHKQHKQQRAWNADRGASMRAMQQVGTKRQIIMTTPLIERTGVVRTEHTTSAPASTSLVGGRFKGLAIGVGLSVR